MQIQLAEPLGPCALHLAPRAESPPEPAARSSPLPSVTPFRQPRGRAAQPSGLRSANFYKPDGGWQANQGWLGKPPPRSSSPPDRKRCDEHGREEARATFQKPPWGFRAAIRVPSLGIRERRELGRPECAAKLGPRAGSPQGEADRRARGGVRARVCVRASAGFSGMRVRGGMCRGGTGFRGNLSLVQTEGACESPPEIGSQKSWRQEGRRKEGRGRNVLHGAQPKPEAESQAKPGLDLFLLGRRKKRRGRGGWTTFLFSHQFTSFVWIQNAAFKNRSDQFRNHVVKSLTRMLVNYIFVGVKSSAVSIVVLNIFMTY